jgi:PEP-CTERM motif
MLKLKSTRTLALVALLSTLASSAAATPVVVSFSTTGLGPLAFGGDTFSMTGASGTLGLDTVLPTSNTVNTALWNVGDSGSFTGTQNLTLSYFLTFDGVTHLLSQSATWSITPSIDTFTAVAGSAPVLFDTPSGDWFVALNAFSFSATSFGLRTQSVSARFTPTVVPEPTSLALLGIGVLGLLAKHRHRKRADPAPGRALL